MTQNSPFTEISSILSELQDTADEMLKLSSLVLQEVDSAQGCDDTGNVVVTIDAENHIKDSTLKPKWSLHIDPPNLGDAHAQADEAALEQRDLILANLIAEAEKVGHPIAPLKPIVQEAETLLASLPGVPTRNMQQLIDDYLAYKASPEGDSKLGSNEDGTVSIEANRLGFVWCGIDEQWAEEQAKNDNSWLISSGVVQASKQAKEKLKQEPNAQLLAINIAQDAIRLITQL